MHSAPNYPEVKTINYWQRVVDMKSGASSKIIAHNQMHYSLIYLPYQSNHALGQYMLPPPHHLEVARHCGKKKFKMHMQFDALCMYDNI